MKKAVLFTVIAMTLLLSACNGGKKETAAADKGGTGDTEGRLVLYSSMTENDLNNLIDLFNEKYPKCEVEVVNGSAGELLARITAEKGNP